jgi:hypothetical protein
MKSGNNKKESLRRSIKDLTRETIEIRYKKDKYNYVW